MGGNEQEQAVVLGVNAAHDASACLAIDGALWVAVAEERLTRRKHQAGRPLRAIEYCLAAGELDGLEAVECVVVNQFAQSDFAAELRRQGYGGRLIVNPSHHLLHAYYAAAAAGVGESAILVADGSGYSYAEHSRHASPLLGIPPPFADMEETESSFLLAVGELDLVERRWGLWRSRVPYFRFPSLGHMFSAASQYIFGDWMHAGKTMGLAPYGDPSALGEPIVTYSDDGIEVDTEWILRLPPRSPEPAHLDLICRDVAAQVQAELEEAMLFLADRLREATGAAHLCLSGGVALNSVANGRLRREGPFDEIFVTPAAGDSGIAVGAAAYGHRQLTGKLPRFHPYGDSLGVPYGAPRAQQALDAVGGQARSSMPIDAADDAAQEIATGRIVGWFTGRSELGPRALGNRSILCDPRGGSIRDELNERVKFREPFRPYAASVLEERAEEYFELDWSDRFMLSVVQIRPEHRELLPSICHVDGSCRIQTVPEDAGPYRRLIEAFYARTGLPIVLNTSLNIRGEPIVESPEDALACFLATNIDLLYLDGRRVEKAVLDPERPDLELVPVPTTSVEIEQRQEWDSDGWAPPAPAVRTRTGHRMPLEDSQLAMLRRVDARRTVGDLAGHEDGDAKRSIVTLAELQGRGLISMIANWAEE